MVYSKLKTLAHNMKNREAQTSIQYQIPTLTWRLFFGWIFRRYHRHTITGDSMLPTLNSADQILIDKRRSALRTLQPFDVVCFTHPTHSKLVLIKRIKSINRQTQEYIVLGDNLIKSTDSRHFGSIKKNALLGRVVCRFN